MAMAFSGFVSTPKKWDRFTREWNAILAREGVSALHMTDLASSGKEFKSWKGDTERRRKFISDLAVCIKRHTNKGFSSGIYIDDYNQVNRDFMLAEKIGQPYTLAGYSCLGALRAWSLNKDVRNSDILVLVEQGDEDQSEFLNLADADGFKATRAPKAYTPAFQAADLIGWKCRTVLQDARKKQPSTEEEADRIMRSLDPLKGSVQSNKGWNLESLCQLCVEKNFPRRQP
jgi:hypothetical protein